MIPSTKPFLPDQNLYNSYLDGIWQRNWITNNGPLVIELEQKISDFLGIAHVSFVSSGAMGLQLALRSLGTTGEIITTPFSYVATASTIVWEGNKAIFADVLRDKWTIDPEAVKAKITKNTKAILATHIYGNACETEALAEISHNYNIPVIYDAAHCFGSKYRQKSLMDFGHMSVLSTHATKLFHTVNGGFVITRTAEEKHQIDRLKNFGHNGKNDFKGPGINGKNSEFHAAMGLALLKDADLILEKRKTQWHYYFDHLKDAGFGMIKVKNSEGFNGAYFPLLCQNSNARENLVLACADKGIEIRRYFSPSLNRLEYLDYASCPVAEMLAENVVCLPLYHDLTKNLQDQVIKAILQL